MKNIEVKNRRDDAISRGTYGGNPLGIAAAHAVLDVIENEY